MYVYEDKSMLLVFCCLHVLVIDCREEWERPSISSLCQLARILCISYSRVKCYITVWSCELLVVALCIPLRNHINPCVSNHVSPNKGLPLPLAGQEELLICIAGCYSMVLLYPGMGYPYFKDSHFQSSPGTPQAEFYEWRSTNNKSERFPHLIQL